MTTSCCTPSRLGGVSLLAVGCFVGGVLASRAFESDPEVRPGAGVAEASFVQPEVEMTPEMMAAMMKEWAATTEHHELLEHFAGNFSCETAFQMGSERMESPARATGELILGGRYVSQRFTMPDFMGMDFEGHGVTGYDKARDRFVTAWWDNLGTGITVMEGEYDEEADTMTWTGEATYPAGPDTVATVPVRHVIRGVTTDTQVMEFWEPSPESGEMAKTGHITYNRR
jgi:hypothetical protein